MFRFQYKELSSGESTVTGKSYQVIYIKPLLM
jgi:hypothetical protein